MPIGIDIASRTVILTKASDLAHIDRMLENLGMHPDDPIDYTQLANTYAVAVSRVQGIKLTELNHWAFGSTDHEVAKLLQSRLTGSTEIAEIRTGADINVI